MPLSRRRLGACALLAALAPALPARADNTDAAYAANPVLRRIAAHDPATAKQLLADIQAALQRPASRALSAVDSSDRMLLEANPMLGKLYIHDASAALLLLKRVKDAAGGAK